MKFSKNQDTKWAFVHTHSNFVAGVSSTQRQEQVNGQIKANLMSNSTLKQIINGFDSVDKSTAARLRLAAIETKLPAITSDPIIDDALKALTSYAGDILREQYTLSLQYICVRSVDNEGIFHVSHKDHRDKLRTFAICYFCCFTKFLFLPESSLARQRLSSFAVYISALQFFDVPIGII
jgi:hypothetical protein